MTRSVCVPKCLCVFLLVCVYIFCGLIYLFLECKAKPGSDWFLVPYSASEVYSRNFQPKRALYKLAPWVYTTPVKSESECGILKTVSYFVLVWVVILTCFVLKFPRDDSLVQMGLGILPLEHNSHLFSSVLQSFKYWKLVSCLSLGHLLPWPVVCLRTGAWTW